MSEIPNEIRALVHTPAEAAKEYVEHIENIQAAMNSGRAITWGVSSMDRAIIPMIPGDIVGIIARPGHGKSTLAAFLAKKTAQRLYKSAQRNHCVVYVTLEQPTEEIEAYFQNTTQYTASDLAWGKVDIETVRKGSYKRLELPIMTVGRSLTRRKKGLPSLTIETIHQTLRSIEGEFKMQPALVVLDYIQKIPLSRYADRTQQVTEAIVGAKALAIDIGAPIVVCVQARRSVDEYKSKIPAAGDCQWASAIEQEADKLLGIWRPILTEEHNGGDITINGTDYAFNDKLFVIKLLKQRWESAGHTFVTHFDPAAVKLSDYETREEYYDMP